MSPHSQLREWGIFKATIDRDRERHPTPKLRQRSDPYLDGMADIAAAVQHIGREAERLSKVPFRGWGPPPREVQVQGEFDLAKWRRLLDTVVGSDRAVLIQQAIADGTILAYYDDA